LCIAADLKMYDCKHGLGNLGDRGAHAGSAKVSALALQAETS
jgi:hypothetical protein